MMTNMLEEMQGLAFQIIASVGVAKSSYVEAMNLSRNEEFEKAEALIAEGDAVFVSANQLHLSLIQKEAQGEQLPFSLLLMHAEDQMLTTEVVKLMAVEIIELRKNK